MDLILWRHADAEDVAPGRPDAERALTGRGEQQAERMARWLEQRLPRDARILVSPARRAQQTARALDAAFHTSPELGPGGDPRALLKAAGWPGGSGAVLVVGHQPTLGMAAALAVTGGPREWRIRKGALWWLEGDVDEVIVRAVISPDLVEKC